MSVKLLGIFDILAGIFFLLSILISMPFFLGVFGIYLLAKGLIFVGFGLDILSMFDIISGGIMIASGSVNIPSNFILMFSGYLIVKGSISLV